MSSNISLFESNRSPMTCPKKGLRKTADLFPKSRLNPLARIFIRKGMFSTPNSRIMESCRGFSKVRYCADVPSGAARALRLLVPKTAGSSPPSWALRNSSRMFLASTMSPSFGCLSLYQFPISKPKTPELLFEKKQLIPALQQLIVSL
jgi:hypothetical protein